MVEHKLRKELSMAGLNPAPPINFNQKGIDMTTVITEADLQKQVNTMVEQAGHLLVKDAVSLGVANEYLVNLSGLRKKRVAWFKPLVDAANLAHKALTKRRSESLEPIDEVDKAVRSMTGAYVAEEKEKQLKEQDRLDELAQKQAKKKEDKLREKAEKEEDPEIRAELEEQAENVYVEPKIAAPTVEKTSRVGGGGSVSFSSDIEIEITHPLELLEEIVSGRVPQTVYEFKPAKLKAWVKAVGKKGTDVPGIRIKEGQKQSVRGG